MNSEECEHGDGAVYYSFHEDAWHCDDCEGKWVRDGD